MLPEQNSCDDILAALTSIGVITDFEIRILRELQKVLTMLRLPQRFQSALERKDWQESGPISGVSTLSGDFPVEWLYTYALPVPLLSGPSKLIGFTMMPSTESCLSSVGTHIPRKSPAPPRMRVRK